MFNDPERLLCSKCPQPLEIQHTCKCENGKCEKVKEEKEKSEIFSNYDEIPSKYPNGSYSVKGLVDNAKELENASLVLKGIVNSAYECPPCPEDADCTPCELYFLISDPIKKTDEKYVFRIYFNYADKKILDNIKTGDRIEINVDYRTNSLYFLSFYEEKSALDLRCEEKVKIIGNCPAYFKEVGYEFDSNIGKCVEKMIIGSGCNYEIPFGSLEECQEVCGKVKKESVEEVIITTDKMEYEQGEIVEVAISNVNNPLYVPFSVVASNATISFYQLKENTWEILTQHCETNCIFTCENGVLNFVPCILYSRPEHDYYKYEGPWELQWSQKECIYENSLCGKESYKEGLLKQVSDGKFKVEFCYFDEEDVNLTNSPGYAAPDKKKCVESEFTIKEKSARCKDNISLTWEKFADSVWVSEDITCKPRHYTYTNLCYEKSREEIWNLCKNEGCVDYTDTGIEVLCFGSACSPKIDISTKKCHLECPG